MNYDLHGDSENPRQSRLREVERSRIDEGVMEAASTGNHGWSWRNRGRQDVNVTLRTRGEYSDIKGLD